MCIKDYKGSSILNIFSNNLLKIGVELRMLPCKNFAVRGVRAMAILRGYPDVRISIKYVRFQLFQLDRGQPWDVTIAAKTKVVQRGTVPRG
jgi:hypothetical protein